MATPVRTRASAGRYVGLQIDGFDEFRKTMRHAPATFRKAIRKVDRAWASKAQQIAAQRATSTGGVAARQAPTIRGSALQTGIRLKAGGADHPEFWGAEFGGGNFAPPTPKSNRHGRPGYTNQFRAWRGNGADAGYFIYPSIRERIVPQLADSYLDELAAALTEAEATGGQ